MFHAEYLTMTRRSGKWLLVVMLIAFAAALAIWLSRLSSGIALVTLVLLIAIGTILEPVAFWWDERVRSKREGSAPPGILKLVGARGVAATIFAPEGKVRIGIELWDAIGVGGQAIDAGETVVVRGVQDGKLLVDGAKR